MLNLESVTVMLRDFLCWAFGLNEPNPQYIPIPVETKEARRRQEPY